MKMFQPCIAQVMDVYHDTAVHYTSMVLISNLCLPYVTKGTLYFNV